MPAWKPGQSGNPAGDVCRLTRLRGLGSLRLIIDPIAGARVRARRKWPVSGESGRVHDPIATRPKHDLQRDR